MGDGHGHRQLRPRGVVPDFDFVSFVPAEAGTQEPQKWNICYAALDSRLRGNERKVF
jgi:hypothetical protein